MENKPSIGSTNAITNLFRKIKPNKEEEGNKEIITTTNEASTINLDIEQPDLYLNQSYLEAFVNGALDNHLKLKQYVKEQIDNDEFIADMVEGIKLDKKIKYKVSREVFLHEHKVKFEQTRLQEINALRDDSLLDRLKRFFKTLSNKDIKDQNKNTSGLGFLNVDNTALGFAELNHQPNKSYQDRFLQRYSAFTGTLGFVLSISALVFIFNEDVKERFYLSDCINSSVPYNPEPGEVLGFIDNSSIKYIPKERPFIEQKVGLDKDIPLPNEEAQIKTVATKAIINGFNSPPIVVAKEEKEGISLLYAGNDVAVITAPPALLDKRVNKSPFEMAAKKIKKATPVFISAEPQNYRVNPLVKLINLSHETSTEQQLQGDAYFSRYASTAIVQMKTYDVPASVLLGTAAILSDWGKLEETVYTNNHFMLACNIEIGKKNIITKETDIAGEIEGHCIQAFSIPEMSYQKFGSLVAATKIIDLKTSQKELTVDGWLKFFAANGIINEQETLAKIWEVIATYQLEDFDTDFAMARLKTLNDNWQQRKENFTQIAASFQQNYQLWSFMNSIFKQKNAPLNLMSYVINDDKKEAMLWDSLTDFQFQFANCKTPLLELKNFFKTNKEALDDYEGTIEKHLVAHRKACEESGNLQLVLFSKPNKDGNEFKKYYNVGAIKDETMFLARLQNPPKLALNK